MDATIYELGLNDPFTPGVIDEYLKSLTLAELLDLASSALVPATSEGGR